ncbi:MAG: Mrp/NBP35 family ATP-binding protein [Pirellulales bacterium]|nr:Mrp/NBP35 family ATP-binding protein [Pirellulales bacterium]
MPDQSAIRTALSDYKDPETGRPLGQDQIRDIELTGTSLTVTVGLATYVAPLWEDAQAEIAALLRQKFADLSSVTVRIAPHQRPALPQGPLGLTVKSVIAVGSGKGGVGKSTIAASIALGLAQAGCEVGLMDADVYGPSIPHLFGVKTMPEPQGGRLQPVETAGLKLMSMGFLVPPGEAVVWRGPMLHKSIQQFLGGVSWGELDYLIVDMPPGTGDVAISLSQSVPLTGAVVVCTPQDVALIDAVKAIAMFGKVNIPILGIVENMSYFVCPDNGKRYDIFGHGGAQRKAQELHVPFLGEVPINMQLRINGDAGETAKNFDVVDSAPYLRHICYRLVKNLSEQHRAAPPLPKLSIL